MRAASRQCPRAAESRRGDKRPDGGEKHEATHENSLVGAAGTGNRSLAPQSRCRISQYVHLVVLAKKTSISESAKGGETNLVRVL